MGDHDEVARQHENDVLNALISRNPNGMRIEHLRRVLPLTEDQIRAATARLAERDVLSIHEQPNTMVPGRIIRSYVLKHPGNYPVRETITIGEIEFPRSFQGDIVGAEDINAFIETIAEYDATVERRVRELAQQLMRRYWVNTATLLGLFVAVFALIAKGTESLSATTTGSAASLLWRNAAALGPLAVLLFGFVLALWWMLRRM